MIYLLVYFRLSRRLSDSTSWKFLTLFLFNPCVVLSFAIMLISSISPLFILAIDKTWIHGFCNRLVRGWEVQLLCDQFLAIILSPPPSAIFGLTLQEGRRQKIPYKKNICVPIIHYYTFPLRTGIFKQIDFAYMLFIYLLFIYLLLAINMSKLFNLSAAQMKVLNSVLSKVSSN